MDTKKQLFLLIGISFLAGCLPYSDTYTSATPRKWVTIDNKYRTTLKDDSFKGAMVVCKKKTAEFCEHYVSTLPEDDQKMLFKFISSGARWKKIDSSAPSRSALSQNQSSYCPSKDENYDFEPYLYFAQDNQKNWSSMDNHKENLYYRKQELVMVNFINTCMKNEGYRSYRSSKTTVSSVGVTSFFSIIRSVVQ